MKRKKQSLFEMLNGYKSYLEQLIRVGIPLEKFDVSTLNFKPATIMTVAVLCLLMIPKSHAQTNFDSPQLVYAYSDFPRQALADLDDDGDLDMMIGTLSGGFTYLKNVGTNGRFNFDYDSVLFNPFSLVDIGNLSTASFADLDNDGDLDMISKGGAADFAYFENRGDATTPLFDILVTNPFSLVGGINSTLYPAFVDLDDDGDYDILSRQEGGYYYHENTGTISAPVYAAGVLNPFSLTSSGASVSFADLDNDGDFDLISGSSAGDSYYFENIGDSGVPLFAAVQINPFSLSNERINSTPCFGDLDDDGDIDVMIGVREGEFHYFENISPLPLNPNFEAFELNAFSIGNMGTAAYADMDGDGDFDIMAGSISGDFYYKENIGSDLSPEFGSKQTNPFSLTAFDSWTHVALADLDDDGDIDLLGGGLDGNFYYYQNIGTSILPSFAAVSMNPFSLDDVSSDNAPRFVDLDRDGDWDIMSGLDGGGFYYMENTGDKNTPVFAVKVLNPFSLTDIGRDATPTFSDLDDDGDLDLLSGSYNGDFFYFENIGSASSPIFGAVQTNPFSFIDIGLISLPSFVDIDGDGDDDMISGRLSNYYFFENTTTALLSPSFSSLSSENPFSLTDIGGQASVTFGDLDNDGDLDLLSGEANGNFKYFENIGSPEAPDYDVVADNPFSLADIGGYSTPTFVDLDGDGDLDIMTGEDVGDFYYFSNTGTNEAPAYAAAVQNAFGLTKTTNNSIHAFADLDGDGDLDMVSGDFDGKVHYYENTGDFENPAFAAVVENPFFLTDIGSSSKPFFMDLDNDGDWDLLVGSNISKYYYFENKGTASEPAFAIKKENPFGLSFVSNSNSAFGDLDNDGDQDLMMGTTSGRFYYKENINLPELVTWDGSTSTDWADASNWIDDILPTSTDNVLIPDEINDPVITSFARVKSIEIEASATVTITSHSLKVNFNTQMDGNMTIASGASFMPLGEINGAGTATVHRSTTFGDAEGKYSVIGSPITTGNTSSLGGIVYKYDETIAYDPIFTQGANRFIVVGAEAMEIGDAYFSANTGDITFVGTPNSGDISQALFYDSDNDGGTSKAGFNLVSNPYTAAISYDALYAGNPDIKTGMYFWDDGGSDVESRDNSDYIVVTSMGAAGGGSNRTANWDGYIRSTQGFFVKANGGANDSLHFTPSMMDFNNNSDAGYFRTEKPITMRFALTGNDMYNDILIGFKEDASLGFDAAYDAEKLQGNNNFQFYSRMEEAIYAIQALPNLTEEITVGLGFDISEAGSYNLELIDAATYGFNIYLKDNLLNKLIDLSETVSYTFETYAIANSERFSLVFSPNAVLAIEDEIISNEMIVFSNAAGLNVRMSQKLKNAKVKIFNINGTLVKEVSQVNFNGTDWTTSFHQEGLFIITVQSEGQLMIKKFVK